MKNPRFDDNFVLNSHHLSLSDFVQMANFSSNSIMQDIRTQLQQSQARATTSTPGRRPLSASVNGSVPSSPFDSESIPLRPEDQEASQTGSSQVTSGSEPEPTVPLVLYPNTGIVGRKRRGAPEEADAIVRRLSRRTNLSQSIQESLSLYAEAVCHRLRLNLFSYCC